VSVGDAPHGGVGEGRSSDRQDPLMSTTEAADAVPVLEFSNVQRHFKIGDEVVRAVDGVSLQVNAGTLVALYGPSGSGKTTLLRIAAGIETPDSGGVLVEGINVAALSPREASDFRMSVLGWVDQDFDLIDGASAVDNAAFKLICAGYRIREARRRAADVLKSVGFGQRLEQRAETLSMGERQRVVMARALSLNPRLLLADEPTGNLDSRRTEAVLDLLRTLTHERAMATLIVTHDQRAMSFADKAYALRDGVLHEIDGSKDADL
jgi:putative ABC transport system ATP-binding protein